MLTKKQLELVLNTIGRLKNPDYERVRDSVMLNQGFVDEIANNYDEYFDDEGNTIKELLTSEQVAEIHKIALTVGSREEAVSLLLEASDDIPDSTSTEEVATQPVPTGSAESPQPSVLQKAEAIQKKKSHEAAKAAEIKRAKEEEFSQLSNAVNVYSKIHDYAVVRKKMKHELIAEVKALMQRGWVPYGGVAYAAAGMSPVGNTGNTFLQAMVRIKK